MNKTFILMLFAIMLIGSVSAQSYKVDDKPLIWGLADSWRYTNSTNGTGYPSSAPNAQTISYNTSTTIYNGFKVHNVTLFADEQGADTGVNVTFYYTNGSKAITTIDALTPSPVKYVLLNPNYNQGIRWINITPSKGNMDQLFLSNITFTYDGFINTTLNSPANNTNQVGTSIIFNATIDTSYTLTNATLYLWNTTGLFNQTTNILTGTTSNTTTFNISNFALGTYYWNVLGCGTNSSSTICSFATTNNTFFWGYNVNTVSFNATSSITQMEGFIENLSLATSFSTLVTSYINYNGTRTLGQITSLGSNNYIVNVNKSSPNENGTYFFWFENNLADGTQINTSTYNQTIGSLIPITVSNPCGTGLYPSLNFTMYDETNLNITTGFVNYNIQYGLSGNTTGQIANGNLSNVNQFFICINNTAPIYTVGYGEIEYGAVGFTTRKFYLFNTQRLTNVSISNDLYMLQNSLATSFQELVQDTSLNLYKGVYTSLLRWYPSLNQYKVVEMGKTDSKGQTVFRVKTEDTDYRTAAYYPDGTLIQLNNPIKFICQVSPCLFTMFITPAGTDYTSLYGVQQNLSYDNNTRTFTFVWNDPAQITSAMNLTVYRQSGLGETAVCSTYGTGFTGIISCSHPAGYGTFNAKVYRSASPPKFITSLVEEIKAGINSLSPGFGLVLTLFLLITVALIGTFSPIAAMILTVVSLIPALFLGAINQAILIGIALLAGIIFWVIRRT